MDNRAIGVFDSGLGGLSCLSGLIERFPEEDFIYFGDTARTPYGGKSDETILRFTLEVANFLVEKNVKMLVIACNTISALCKSLLQERYPHIPVVDIIEPTVSHLTSNKLNMANVGLVATKATIRSGVYERALKESGFGKPLASKASPLFVPLVEEGIIEGPVVESVIEHYVSSLVNDDKIDALILGCTHYPLIEGSIRKLYPSLNIINPSHLILDEVERVLCESDMQAAPGRIGNRIFWASDLSDTYLGMIDRIVKDGEGCSRQFLEHRWPSQ